MPQPILIIIIFPLLTIILIHFTSAFQPTNFQYLNCANPRHCDGNNISISFPFSLPESPSYCGFPGYELSCSNHSSDIFINLTGVDYIVKDINYTHGFITLVDPNSLDNSCPHTFTNTRVNSKLFDFDDLDFNMTVYINCSTLIPNLPVITCLNDGLSPVHSYYVLDKLLPPSVTDLLADCKMEASVLVNELSFNSSSVMFWEALQKGFGLKWIAGKDWCKPCIDSGGVCGYNSTYATSPTCLCSDNTALGTCSYQRVASYEHRKKRMIWRRVKILLPLGIVLTISATVFLIWLIKRIFKGTSKSQKNQIPLFQLTDLAPKLEIGESSLELSLIKFSTILDATGNFSAANKLGRGGFGSVYKGQLPEGQSIAVKRLDSCSGQGSEEFMNEIRLISKLQHQNLVKLLGCSVEGDEKLLVYEYMPNNSLDYHLFDPIRKEKLDWSKRFAIIDGIAQGLLYLHKYSRVRIIHRDLKSSNILLDPDMSPKISDFGIARIFDANNTQASTKKIVGTYGYMSPEYAMEGIFSIKSDVFSFGVLMLEIISGKRNTTFHKSGKALNLLVYAWELWKDGNLLDFVDPSLGDNILVNEVSKCIIVALSCVQEYAEDRPTMPNVITMLSSDVTTLPNPKKPAFFTGENERASESLKNELATQNNLTFSDLKGR